MHVFLLALLAAAGVWPCVLVWRNAEVGRRVASDVMEETVLTVSASPSARRSGVRSMVATVCLLACVTISLWIFELYDGIVALHLPLILLTLLFSLAHVSISLFNRPRFLVPPHMRQDPGRWTKR